MCFIHDDQLPGDFEDVRGFCSGEVIGTQYDGVCLLEWIRAALLDELMKIFRFQDDRSDKKLFKELAAPLFPQRGWQDDQDTPFSLRPQLTDD
jgi:hypothetical protein